MDDALFATLLRSQLYTLLARSFCPPPRTLTDWQAQNPQEGELAAAVDGLPHRQALVSALRALERARAAIRTEADLELLRDDSLRLFGNLLSQHFPPYETEYTGGGDFRKNQELADLMGFYRAFGLDLHSGEELRERPDHLAVELEFLHFLCWKEAASRQEGNQEHIDVCLLAEQEFLRDHLGRWADLFARGVEKTASTGFYQALSGLLRAVVAQEAATLGVTLEPAKATLPCRSPEPEAVTCGSDLPCFPARRHGGE